MKPPRPGEESSSFSFPYRTRLECIQFQPGELRIECLESLDETIDAFFAEYQRSGRTELFEGLCPYFGVPWPAGRALARRLEKEGARWRDRETLELGCGLALPSLILARAGALATATDCHPDVPVFLERNRRENGLSGPEFLYCDWRLERSLPEAELVLGSDLVYSREQPEELFGFLRRMPGWREALFSDPGRPYWERFVALARSGPWAAEEELFDSAFFLRLRR